jgi:ribonuclease HI
LWMTLEGLSHSGVRWQHVYGHRGDPNNERVDTIARAYAAGTCPLLFCGQSGAPDDPVIVPTATPWPPRSVSETPARPPTRASGRAYYVSIVHGTVAIDMDWPVCAARVRGVSGAQYRKVRTPEELAAFCAAHGVEPPQGLPWDSA